MRGLSFGIVFLLVGSIILLMIADSYIRRVIREYPMSVATGVVQNLLDSAMETVLSDSNMPNMSEIDRVIYDGGQNVMSIQVDTAALNRVKTAFVSKLKRVIYDYGDYITIKVPIGTLIGNEYTLGRGPKVSFKLQFSTTFHTSLQSEFAEASINSTLHTIYMNVVCNLFLIIPWGNVSERVNTNYIVAQTIIAGKIPEAFTNVFDANGEVTDDLFNYGAEVD